MTGPNDKAQRTGQPTRVLGSTRKRTRRPGLPRREVRRLAETSRDQRTPEPGEDAPSPTQVGPVAAQRAKTRLHPRLWAARESGGDECGPLRREVHETLLKHHSSAGVDPHTAWSVVCPCATGLRGESGSPAVGRGPDRKGSSSSPPNLSMVGIHRRRPRERQVGRKTNRPQSPSCRIVPLASFRARWGFRRVGRRANPPVSPILLHRAVSFVPRGDDWPRESEGSPARLPHLAASCR